MMRPRGGVSFFSSSLSSVAEIGRAMVGGFGMRRVTSFLRGPVHATPAVMRLRWMTPITELRVMPNTAAISPAVLPSL